MAKVPLLDVVRPYLFVGVNLGDGVHHVLEMLHVDEIDTAFDDDGVVIWGVARIDSDDPRSPVFSRSAGGGASAPASTDPPMWEWHDVAVRFRLTAARRAAGSLPVGDVTDTDLQALLGGLGATTGTDRTDYPGTQFRLELLFDLVSVRIPGLIGAKLDGWLLVPDPEQPTVKLSLPNVALVLTQDSADDTDFDVDLAGFGDTLDGVASGSANLVALEPPLVLVPGKLFGFGLRDVVLDWSADTTPPELLERFGIGDDFRGLYLKEARIFWSTQRNAGSAYNVIGRDLVLGFEPTFGLWGDLSFDWDLIGDHLAVALRVCPVVGKPLTPTWVRSDEDNKTDWYTISLPENAGPETENYVLMVDVTSGSAPFVSTVATMDIPDDPTDRPDDAVFSDPTNGPEDISVLMRTRLFSRNDRVMIRVVGRNSTQRRVVVLDVTPNPIANAEREKAQVPPAVLDPFDGARLDGRTDTDAVILVAFDDATLEVDGDEVPLVDRRARVSVGPGQARSIQVTRHTAAQTVGELKAYFATDVSDHPTSLIGRDGFVAAYQAQSTPPKVRVFGYASYDGTPNVSHNQALSDQRAATLAAEIRKVIPGAQIVLTKGYGEDGYAAPEDIGGDLQDLLAEQTPSGTGAAAVATSDGYQAGQYQIAVARLVQVDVTNTSYSTSLHRDEMPPPGGFPPLPRPEEPPVPPPQHPPWLRHAGGTLRFERDLTPIAGEARMTIDVQTAHEDGLNKFRADIDEIRVGLEEPDELARLPQGDPNPDDGVIELRFGLAHDPTTDTVRTTLSARAAETDRDGLWSWGTIPAADAPGEPASDGWRDLLGLYFVFAPLLGADAPDEPHDGKVVPLAIALGTPVVLTTLGFAHAMKVTHYGVELATTVTDGEVSASILVDVEVAVWLNLAIGPLVIATTRPDKPVKVRYKAIGFGFEVLADQPTAFFPVFDAARGYTIDLADSGSLRVLPALGDTVGDLIQVLGAKIARTNPLNLEVELGLGVDLGVVTVDRFTVRLPVDPVGTPTITAIGVGIDVEGALTGRGYLKIADIGLQGQLDLTLPSVGVRAAATLSVLTVTEGDRTATGVLAGLQAELPSGLPLGGTGLSVYGFLGLFAMHHARLENPGARIPSLDWFSSIVAGDPTDLRGWGPKLDRWAFGVGLVAGSIEGGTVMNLKGLLALEVPGPRVLLFANAAVLKKRPPTRGTESGALLAVVDIDPQRILIGLKFEYHIENVLDVKVPVEAGFFYDPPLFPPSHFYVDAGTIARPVTAKVLSVFDATAYWMVHGDGIPDFPLGPLSGFAVATGFEVSLVWGRVDLGLYLKVSAGLDLAIGFEPLYFAGRLHLDGELRLFIVSISAHGEIQLKSNGAATRLSGEVCGRVDFFFFSVKGCVKFALGTEPGVPEAPPLLRDLVLQSRSPALIEGTGVDRGIDTVICHGTSNGSVPVETVRNGDQVVTREVRVPIDTIPLAQLEVAPNVAPGATIDGTLSSGLPPGFGGGWQKRGPNYLKYDLHAVELQLVTRGGAPVAPGTPTTTEGPRPFTWRTLAQQPSSDGLPVGLALLDWKPTDVDKALVQGPALDSLVDGVWGSVCTPIAEAAPVLWTFGAQAIGPSPGGWRLLGEPWPDGPGTTRSTAIDPRLRVLETWRTGTFVDGLLGVTPARVIGIDTSCPNSKDPKEICVGKLLEAPFEPLASALEGVIGAGDLLDALRKIDDAREKDLRDVVRLTGTVLVEATLLVYARIKMVVSDLMNVRAYGPDGTELGGVSTSWKEVTSDADLPPRWTDPSGPWWDDVVLARAYGSVLAKARDGFAAWVVNVKLPGPALRIDVGVSPLALAIEEFGMTVPSWFLAVVEGLTLQERQRAEEDQQGQDDLADGLEDALGDQTHALLWPDARYDVVVRYDVQVGAKDPEADDPNEIVVLRTDTGETATRTFYTDAAAPRSLDPWLLAQFPAPDEGYHFTDDPVVVVFATDDVLELFAAYDRELRAVARAASFRGSAETPEAPLTHLVLTGRFERLGGVVLSPWEATVRRQIGPKPCRDFDPDADRHGRVTLPFLLDPRTDYVLDLESLRPDGTVDLPPVSPPEVARRPLFRRSFTTSRYNSRQALAEDVRTARVVGVLAPDLSAFDTLPEAVGDDRFDAAVVAAGLPLAHRPDAPRITILWSDDAVPAALAILLETPEPVWRTRIEPEPEHDGSGTAIVRWKLAPQTWLLVDELVKSTPTPVFFGGEFVRRGTGTKVVSGPTIRELRDRYVAPYVPPLPPPPPPPTSWVSRFVHDSSGTRTLVRLAPGARGHLVSLGLARRLHPLLDADPTDTPVVLCEVDLVRAPWEETP